MMAGIVGAPFWLIFLSALAVGLSGTKNGYELALGRAMNYARIHDLFKPLDEQEFRDDIQISDVLFVPPYTKYIKKLRTARPGKPVELKYMFHASRDLDVPNLRKRLLCTANIDEFLMDNKFYYVLPYRKNLKCEEYQEYREDEEYEELTAESSPGPKSDPINPFNDFVPFSNNKQVRKTKRHIQPPTVIQALTTNRTTPSTTTARPKTSPKVNTPRRPRETTSKTSEKPQTTKSSGTTETDIENSTYEKVQQRKGIKKSLGQPRVGDVAKSNKSQQSEVSGGRTGNHTAVQYKLKNATVNLDFSGLVGQGIRIPLLLNEANDNTLKNAVINIKFGSLDIKKVPTDVAGHKIDNQQRHLLKNVSIDLNNAVIGDELTEVQRSPEKSEKSTCQTKENIA